MATTLHGSLSLRAREYADFSVDTDEVTLRRPEDGKNVELTVNGRRYEIGRIGSVFPLTHALGAVAFFDKDGEEIGVMKHLDSLDDDSRGLLMEELEKAYFMPRVKSIDNVTESLGIESWTVTTDKGERTFDVRDPQRGVRKMAEGRVIIKDVDGNRYEVTDWYQLDRKSMTILMQYL